MGNHTADCQALTGGFHAYAKPFARATSVGRRMADQSIDKRERYVAFATHCLQLAKVAADRKSRTVLREMAAEWLRLAEVAG
jgi:hypothetical protein